MQVPEGYELGKLIHRTRSSQVWAAERAESPHAVVLKQYTRDSLNYGESRAGREFELLRLLAGPGVPRAVELVSERAGPILVLERAPGLTLRAWARQAPLSPEDLLDVGIQIAGALARVHEARLLHRDVHPGNILVDPSTRAACLLDFGLARPLGTAEQPGDASSLSQDLAGALPYISPEQTGRMNRGLDSRSDLYGLGATLYAAITGKAPFSGRDALTLIHAHLALLPQPACERRPGLPSTLSRIFGKLLEKEPEERYQTALGLRRDLETCLAQLRRSGSIDDDLELGRADAPLRPLFARKLYGRDTEVNALQGAYARAARGAAELLLLEGGTGTGKSALVDVLGRPAAETGGYIASGKFDLYRRDVPYSGWIALLRSFVDQVLAERDARVQQWREQLRASLGKLAGALVTLVPELALLLGDVSPVPPLPPRETRARLTLALRRWVRGAGTAEHPLVLMLDDAQWADEASEQLTVELLEDLKGVHCLLLACYRSDDVASAASGAARRARALAERAERCALATTHVRLAGLDPEAARRMLSDALGHSEERVAALTDVIARKAGTSPLAVQQFVLHMHGLGLIRHVEPGGWSWSDAEIASAEIPEGAVAFMLSKLRGLEPLARQVLQFVSCIADEFDISLLVELSSHTRSELEPVLFSLAQAGLLVPSAGGYRFAHDRVREAAQSTLGEAERAGLHAQIARFLLERLSPGERGERILEIADHLDRGLAHLPDAQRVEAIRINLAAGQRALADGAPDTARGFLRVGRELWRAEDASEDGGALGFALWARSMECAALCQEFQSALALADELERSPLAPMQRAELISRRLRVLALTGGPREAAEYALRALREFGIRWPIEPTDLRARAAIWRTLWRLRGTRIDRALRRAEHPDPSFVAPIVVIGAVGIVLSRVNSRVAALASAWVVSSNARQGFVSAPAYSLAAFGAAAQPYGLRTHQLRRLERASSLWQEAHPDPVHGPRQRTVANGVLRPWWTPRRELRMPLEQTAVELQELGDLEFSYYCRFLSGVFGALVGDPVADVHRHMAELCSTIERAGASYVEPRILSRPYGLLQRSELSEELVREELAASEQELSSSSGNPSYTRTVWLLVLCVYGHWGLAEAQVRATDTLRFGKHVHLANFTLYAALAGCANAERAGSSARRRARVRLRRALRQLRRWARASADLGPMVQMLEAESEAQRGASRRAVGLYQKAARAASERDQPHHAALCLERTGQLLAELSRAAEALVAFSQAINDYRAWGALAKGSALEQRITETGLCRRSPERTRRA